MSQLISFLALATENLLAQSTVDIFRSLIQENDIASALARRPGFRFQLNLLHVRAEGARDASLVRAINGIKAELNKHAPILWGAIGHTLHGAKQQSVQRKQNKTESPYQSHKSK